MRGMQLNEVEKHLKLVAISKLLPILIRLFRKDLRLKDDYVPLNYAIDLSVNVRGHTGANKSDFNRNNRAKIETENTTIQEQ